MGTMHLRSVELVEMSVHRNLTTPRQSRGLQKSKLQQALLQTVVHHATQHLCHGPIMGNQRRHQRPWLSLPTPPAFIQIALRRFRDLGPLLLSIALMIRTRGVHQGLIFHQLRSQYLLAPDRTVSFRAPWPPHQQAVGHRQAQHTQMKETEGTNASQICKTCSNKQAHPMVPSDQVKERASVAEAAVLTMLSLRHHIPVHPRLL